MAERIQMSRQRPWRADHPDAIIVARPSRWGNPFQVGYPFHLDDVVRMHRELIIDREAWIDIGGDRQRFRSGYRDFPVPTVADIQCHLRGHDLACWCALDQACHADTLIEIANGPLLIAA